MKAQIKLENNFMNQEIAREIRDRNRDEENLLQVSFSDDLSAIILEGEKIWIPEKELLTDELSIEGNIKEIGKRYEITPKDRGKTVNLHLDVDLVAELEQIKSHVKNKTQHDLLLEFFKRGLDQYKKEKE
jgi:hypothetical protein